MLRSMYQSIRCNNSAVACWRQRFYADIACRKRTILAHCGGQSAHRVICRVGILPYQLA